MVADVVGLLALWFCTNLCTKIFTHEQIRKMIASTLKIEITRHARKATKTCNLLSTQTQPISVSISSHLTSRPAAQGIVKRGFDFGKMDELKDQAKRGGVRLPGVHSMKEGHRCIYTDPAYNMGDFLKPKNIVRVQGERLCSITLHVNSWSRNKLSPTCMRNLTLQNSAYQKMLEQRSRSCTNDAC